MKSTSNQARVHLEFVSDAAILISFEQGSLLESYQKVLSLFRKLEKQQKWPITNLHPAYTSCLIELDLNQCDPSSVRKDLEEWVAQQPLDDFANGDRIEIPVSYGSEDGPDLSEVAHSIGLTPKEVIELHSQAEYTVAFLGFAPGFPYLLGLPEKLQCPRKKTPRIRVPAGSVAIAGLQAGIYPSASPGGWQLIGRTDEILFDPSRDQPTLLRPGDKVHFVPESSSKISKQKVFSIKNASLKKKILRVEDPGFFSTVQDQGRNGWTHFGVSPGGAADPLAMRLGQQLVGNSKTAAAIECTSQGGIFTFLQDTWFAVTGANCDPRLDQQKIKMWTALPASAGQRLVLSEMQNHLRSYLHVHGGMGVTPLLGGQGTDVSGGWGGFEGRPLKRGDELPMGDQIEASPTFRRCRNEVKALYQNVDVQVLRVTRGPQWEWFSDRSLNDFFTQELEVTNEVNRLGMRLKGPAISSKNEFKDKELISEGIADGAIQIPAGGQPMILFCEQRTTGGYPKIANVIQADRFRLGQLQPGQRVDFQLVDLQQAWKLNSELEQNVATLVEKF